MKEYDDLKKLRLQWKGKVCLFGAGLIGGTWGYDLVDAAGFHVDFYCDNKKPVGTVIRDGVRTISLDELRSLKDDVLVFITVGDGGERDVEIQLAEMGIYNAVKINTFFLQTFIESLLETGDQDLKAQFHDIVDDAAYLRKCFKYLLGYELNLDNPQTFNEKLQWLKIHDHNPEYTKMVDKYEVKEYVAGKIGKEHIIPTLGVWDCFDEIDFDALPEQFVLKCTHDSGGGYICMDKSKFNKKEAKSKIDRCLKRNYYWIGREWVYKNVRPRILAEKYLIDDLQTMHGSLVDYKVHCFNGVPTYIQAIGNRDYRAHTGSQTIFDFEWEEQIWSFGDYPRYKTKLQKPLVLKELYNLSELLCNGYPYVRLDFYIVENKIFFGEITFIPLSGYYKYNEDWKKEIDLMLGNKIGDFDDGKGKSGK